MKECPLIRVCVYGAPFVSKLLHYSYNEFTTQQYHDLLYNPTYIMHLFINTVIYMCHNSSFVSPVMYFRHDFTMILFLHKFTYNHLYTCIQFSDLT